MGARITIKPEELNLIIQEGEGLAVEFKEKYIPKIDRDIVAFSNSKGGLLLIGVDDSGKIVGETLTNKMKAEINSIARNCDPPIHIKSVKQVGKIVITEVSEGEEKPYSSSSGYYRRLDAVTQKMTQKEIRLIFKNTSIVPFEDKLNKDISFNDISKDKIKAFFKEVGVSIKNAVPQDVLSSLNLSKKSSIKNAGILFFAKQPRNIILQCQMTLVAFTGTNRVDIYDRKDVQDDLLTQFNEAVIFLQRHLNVRSEIKGVNRKDICEIPIEALREAVANAIIHRDYSVRGTSLMVEVHENRVVISNPGGLPEGLSPQSLMNISVRRNELIADVFARMDKVERMGTGIKRMRDFVKSAGLPYPKIKSDLFFTITFGRPAYSLKSGQPEVVRKGGQKRWSELTGKQREVLELIKGNLSISRKNLALKLSINESAVQKHIENLKKKNVLERIGSAKGGYWKVETC